MAVSKNYYIIFHSLDFVCVPDSQPPTVVDQVIKAGYYRDLDGNAGNIATESAATSVQTNDVQSTIPTSTGGSVTVLTDTTGAVRTFFGATSDDILHVAPRALSYTKSAWQFLNAAGDLLSRPLFEDVRCVSTMPPNTLADIPLITAVTPSDSVSFDATSHIYVGGAGNLALLLADGVTSAIIPVVANTLYDFRAIKIKATGTTATGILRW